LKNAARRRKRICHLSLVNGHWLFEKMTNGN
jgi:hypothetical protein